MRELTSGFFFFGFSLFLLWESLRLGLGTLHKPGSGFVPFCMGLFICLFSLKLIRNGWGIRDLQKAPPARCASLAMLSTIVYSLLLEPLGFVVPTLFLVAILFYLGDPRRWWVILGMSALVTFLVYLVFGILLQVYLPRGIVGI